MDIFLVLSKHSPNKKPNLTLVCSRGQVISAHYSNIDIKIEDDSGDGKIVEVQDFKAVSST